MEGKENTEGVREGENMKGMTGREHLEEMTGKEYMEEVQLKLFLSFIWYVDSLFILLVCSSEQVCTGITSYQYALGHSNKNF